MSSSHPKPTPCLSDLEIADLIAGRLQGDARVRVLRHLAECEACYDVYAEARALLADEDGQEHGEEDGGSPPVGGAASVPAAPLPFPTRSRSRWMPAVAAGLAAGIALAWWLPTTNERPGKPFPRLGDTPMVIDGVSLSPLPRPSESRSGSRTATDDPEVDFRLGAAWAHLEAASRHGLAPESRSTAERLREDFAQIKLDPELRRDLDSLLDQLAQPGGEAPQASELARLGSGLSKKMAELGYEFDLGRFAEFGRIAARARHREFFAPGGAAESYLHEVSVRSDLTPEARQGLDRIAKAWPAPDASAKTVEAAAGAFTSLILSYDQEP